jgi:iron(III) transport system permease protein
LDLGRIRILTAGLVLLLPVALALPFGILLWASFQPFYSVPTVQALSHMTLDNYSSAFANANIRSSVMNSMLIGVLASSLVIGLSTVVSWIILRTRIRGRHLLDLLVALVLVFPGVVLGLAILRTYLVVPVPIYGTLWILVIAYVARFVPFAQRFIHPGLIQIQKELEESAQMSGAGWMAIFRRILIPLLMPALFGAWIWVFLTSVRELSMSVLLVSPQSQVVATTLFALWQEGQLSEMAAYSVALTTALATLALILRRISGRWGIQA